jgi:hypothetical protein
LEGSLPSARDTTEIAKNALAEDARNCAAEPLSPFLDTGVQPGERYVYTVVSVARSGLESDRPAAISLTVPRAPPMASKRKPVP